jgi:integral membrane sensor domain MASE1
VAARELRNTVVLYIAVIAAYVAAAAVGFRLAFVAEQVTTVWAPTGIALAALLLGGLRLWPAVWIGALLANLTTDAPADGIRHRVRQHARSSGRGLLAAPPRRI